MDFLLNAVMLEFGDLLGDEFLSASRFRMDDGEEGGDDSSVSVC